MTVDRPRVLMIAFACNPEGSGEHWLGWGWAEQAAKSCDVTLLTWDRFAKEIERRAPSFRVRPVCVGVPDWVDQLGDRSGLGRWLRQIIWHRRASTVAAQLHAQWPFALAHQTTFHTFRIPLLVADWKIPAVWGPIAGGESPPPGFGLWLGRLKTAEAARKAMNRAALARPRVRQSLRAAHAIFVSNQTTLNFLPPSCRERCIVVPPNALRESPPVPPPRPRDHDAPLNLLMVGNCVATRSIPLVLEALGRAPKLPWQLTVVGNGRAIEDWKKRAAEKNMAQKVLFTGGVPRSELASHYARADVFVFPALRDSGGSGLLEAMSFGLPVVCCDWGGPAEMVDENSGVKVPVNTPEAAIKSFAAAFERLHADPSWRRSLGEAGFNRVKQMFSWERKREVLETTYARCLGLSR